MLATIPVFRSTWGRVTFNTAAWLMLPLLMPCLVTAAAPCMRFDVTDLIDCRDVTTPEFREINSRERMVEANFEVSALLRWSEASIFEILYVVEIPHRDATVADYAPKKQMTTDITGKVNVQHNNESSSSMGLNASATFDHLLTAGGSASHGSKQAGSVRYEMLPPLSLLAASGTMARGSAAYFKLRPSMRTSMDGARRFSVTFRVPRSWRGGYVRIRCLAYERSRGKSRDIAPVCGSSSFLVGLYQAGDYEAKAVAESLIQSEHHLRSVARTMSPVVDGGKSSSITKKLAALIGIGDGKTPTSWLENVLVSPARQRSFDFQDKLPSEVNQAINAYTDARWNLHLLGVDET